MNSIIKDLYYGRISTWENSRPQDPEYIHATNRIGTINEHFRSTLPSEQWDQLKELESLYTQALNIENIDAFSHGLSIGILLMIDALNFKDNRLPE